MQAYSFTVTAVDAYGNVATGYTGTIHFSSDEDHADLAADYTFTAADAGTHTFVAAFNRFGTFYDYDIIYVRAPRKGATSRSPGAKSSARCAPNRARI
jgi:hypothetical protein